MTFKEFDERRVAGGSKNQKIECLTLKVQTLKLVHENGQYFPSKNPFEFSYRGGGAGRTGNDSASEGSGINS